MEKDNLKFSNLYFLINEKNPIKSDFKDIPLSFQKELNGEQHEVKTCLTDSYFWLYSNYGSPNPRPAEVLNTQRKEREENPRLPTQTELLKQIFYLFSFDNNTLYINNIKKQNIFEFFIKDYLLEKRVSIKRFIINKEEFLRKIDKVKSFDFSTGNIDLLRQNADFQSAFADFFGMENPVSFSLKAIMNIKKNKFLCLFDKLEKNKKDGSLKKVIIVGQDDQGFEEIFNLDTFVEKLNFNLKKNNEGLYDEDAVKTILLEEIEKGVVGV